MNRLKKLFITVFVIGLFLGGSALGYACVIISDRCFSHIAFFQSKKLKTMQRSLAANLVLETADEIHRTEHDDGQTMGKPNYAEIAISYKPKDNFTPADVHAEIKRALMRDQWRFEVMNIEPNEKQHFRAAKVYDQYTLEASVLIQTLYHDDSRPQGVYVLIRKIPLHSEYKQYE